MTYKLLSKKKYKKAKALYVLLNAIYYFVSLTYTMVCLYLISNEVVINESIYIFLKLLVIISFLFAMSLELSMYTNVKKSQSNKSKKSSNVKNK